MADFSLADIAAVDGKSGGWGTAGALGIGALAGLFFGSAMNGGGWFGGGRGGYNAGFANAIGYENLATSNEVQRGFDNQNSMANQRDILATVNSVGAQGIAATNQVYHDIVGYVGDKYNEITRDIAAVQVSQAQALANQNQCCCDTKLLLTEQNAGTNANIAQSRYDAALNTAGIKAEMAAGFADLKQAMAQSKIESMAARIQQLELQAATGNTVKYPTSMSYTAGPSPFCNCNGYGYGCNGF